MAGDKITVFLSSDSVETRGMKSLVAYQESLALNFMLSVILEGMCPGRAC